MVYLCLLAACILGGLHTAIHAQVLTPASVIYNGNRDTSISVQATQAWFNLQFEEMRTRGQSIPATGRHYPKDSLLKVSAKRAVAWVQTLQTAPVKGLQLNPYGVINVIANQEGIAEQQISARLASTSLSFNDRAFTLQLAVIAFASSDFPGRLRVAERYLKQLDAMGSNAAFYQFNARKSLVYAYYRLGQSPDIIRIGTRMFELVSVIPFNLRQVMYTDATAFEYGAVIDALSGRPNGSSRIRALNELLLAATVPPAALVMHDSVFAWNGQLWKQGMQSMVDVSQRVGQQGNAIVANYWINRGMTRDSQVVSVANGKIHVIEVGHFSCGSCIAAVPGLNRLQEKYPNVDFTFLTWTSGVWGNRIVDSKTECDRLAEHFLNNLKAKVAIGVAFTPRDSTEEGLWVPQIATKTWDKTEYPQASKPTFYILDGKGMIRRVVLGYSRDLEENISQIIDFLQREASTDNNRATVTPVARM